jgi:hypothetical protein
MGLFEDTAPRVGAVAAVAMAIEGKAAGGGRMAIGHFGWLLCFLWRRLARPMMPTL